MTIASRGLPRIFVLILAVFCLPGLGGVAEADQAAATERYERPRVGYYMGWTEDYHNIDRCLHVKEKRGKRLTVRVWFRDTDNWRTMQLRKTGRHSWWTSHFGSGMDAGYGITYLPKHHGHEDIRENVEGRQATFQRIGRSGVQSQCTIEGQRQV